MRAIDLHAHLTPQCFQREVLAEKTWYGMTSAAGELFRAGRVTEVGGLGQRFQPKEHQVLALG